MHTTEQLSTALAGRYAIEKQIGAGGMATVYLARDLKHNRQVALKVLNPELGAVLGAERFMAEIEVTANLHHPNLLPLFDSGEARGLLFYVMPYIEGETLRVRLQRERQLGVDEAVRIGAAIASALDYAHRHHVIHRDLKPENILMHEGQPLVMDFGIALAVSKAGGARITQTGLSLGTPQYMSPEQATGDHVLDARTDIYSLGAVIYEMLVGDPPHTGSTVQAVIAKVITEQPSSVRATRPNVPEHVEAAVMTALAKIPADRFGAAADFGAALTGMRSVPLPGSVTRGVATAGGAALTRRVGVREAAAWILAVVGLGAAAWIATRAEPEIPMRRFTVDLPDSVVAVGSPLGATASVAISPDGRLIAFVGSRRLRYKIFLRRADEAEARELPGTEQASRPTFSQDGRTLYFLGETRALHSISVNGGTARKLADSVGTISTGDDGTIYFVNGGQRVWALQPEGGSPRVVAELDSASGLNLVALEVLPGSRRALAVIRGRDRPSGVAEVDLLTGKIEKSSLDIYGFRYVSPGLVVFISATGQLRAAPAGDNGFPLVERAVTLAEDVTNIGPFGLDFAVASREGSVVYRRQLAMALPATSISAVSPNGSVRVFRQDGKRYDQPIVSPDGRRAVIRVGASNFNNGDLWLLDLGSGSFTPLTRGNGSYRPAWSRDGKRVLFLTGTPEGSAVRAVPWDGSGPESVVVQKPQIAEFAEGPRGGWSVIRTYGARDILLLPTDSVATAQPRALIAGPANETNPSISPNGRLLAYNSDQSGEREVYVTALPGPGPRVPVSIGGGNYARWSADGSRLYYRAGSSLRVATIVERPELAVVKRDLVPGVGLSDDTEFNYSVMANGAFLTTPGPPALPTTSRIGVITNWQSLLRPGRPVAPQP